MVTWLRTYWSKVVSGLAIAAVAGVAGVVSYTHIYELTLALHQPVMVAKLMPFAVDGLIVVGSVVLLQALPGQPWLGWLGVGPGVAISLFANVESGIRYGWLSAAWAGVPAASFFLATFLLERWLKAQAGQPRPLAVSGAVPASAPVPVPAPELNGHGTEAERLFAGDLAAGDVPSIRRIRSALHVGQPRAREIQAHLETLTPAGRDIARIRDEIRQDAQAALPPAL
jgi:hypothetical protein